MKKLLGFGFVGIGSCAWAL